MSPRSTPTRPGTQTTSPDLLDSSAAGPAAVRGGVLRLLGYFAGVLLTVGSAALLFRHLGVVDGGRYVTVIALASVAAGVTEIGLTTIGVREMSVRVAEERRRFMRSLVGMRLVLALAGTAVAVGFAAIAGYDQTMVLGAALASAAVLTTALQSTLGVSLMVQLRLGWITLLEFVRQALTALTVVVLVWLDSGLLTFLAAAIPAGVVVLLATVLLVRSDVPITPGFDPSEWRALLRDVLPFAAATIVAALYFRAAMIVLSLVSTETETGYFGASFRITEVLLLVPGLVVGAAFPIFSRAARDDHERLAYSVDRVFQAMVLVGLSLMVALAAGAPFAIAVVAGSEFGPSADVLKLHAVALMLAFPNSAIFYALLSLRRHRMLLYLASGALVVNLVFAAWWGSVWGATGAATATLVAELVALGAGIIALRHADAALVPRFGFLPRVAPAALAGLAVMLVPGLPAAAAAIIGTTLFAGAAYALGAVPRELLDALPRQRIA